MPICCAEGAKVEVVFLGDSITDSWSNERFGGFFPGKGYVNRGISGQTTPQMLVRMKPDVLAFSPKVIVLLAGTNDIAGNTGPETDEDIQRNIAAIAELATANGARMVLASVLPVSAYHVTPGAPPQTVRRPPARINTLNTWLKTYAAAHKHVYLDYFSATADEKGMLRAELERRRPAPQRTGAMRSWRRWRRPPSRRRDAEDDAPGLPPRLRISFRNPPAGLKPAPRSRVKRAAGTERVQALRIALM